MESCRHPARSRGEQSQRDCVLQPKVARNELPWVIVEQISQPQRDCGLSVLIWRAGNVGHNPVGTDAGRFAIPRRVELPIAPSARDEFPKRAVQFAPAREIRRMCDRLAIFLFRICAHRPIA